MPSTPIARAPRAAVRVLVVLALAAASAGGQGRRDVIRGRVTSDSGKAIAGADVIVTMAPTAQVFRQQSDSAGNYAVTIDNGTGEYLLFVGATGRVSFRRRLARAGGDTTFTINVTLAPAVTTVAAARVTAQRPRPGRSLDPNDRGATSGVDKTVDGVTGALPPEMAASVDAMASTIPGLSTTGGGFSAFGLSSADNQSTLNGLAFSSDLPRDARSTTRFQTSPWDPTVGGFAGVLASRQLQRGGNISSRSGHATVDDPVLQFADAVASRVGGEYSNYAFSQGGTGAYALDEYFFNYGFQLNRRTAPVVSLVGLDPDALSIAGVSRDSAVKFLQTLDALRVPARRSGIPAGRVTTAGSFIHQLDHALPPGPPGSVPTPTWRVTAFGSFNQSEAFTLSPTTTPVSSGTNTGFGGALQGFYSRYFGANGDYISETTSAFSYGTTRGSPYLDLPSGNVLVTSALPNGSTALGSLGFGGSSFLEVDNRSWAWELIHQLDFLAGGYQSLPMKLYFQSRLDGYRQFAPGNRLGSFTFPSLAALAGNAPSAYSRTLHTPDAAGGAWTGAAAWGASWTKGTLSMTGGLRVDANVFTATPQENDRLAALFGARNDHAPNSVGVSPRVGFTLQLPGQRGFGTFSTGLATVSQGPTVLRGGVGLFRSLLPTALLSTAMTNTGLPGGAQRLSCIGPAAPIPDWAAYSANEAAVPSTCAGGAATFTDTVPAVTMFHPQFRPAESVRATLGVSKSYFGTYFSLDAVYAANRHQAGTVDLNFAGMPRFSLAGEANRPVFVSATSIDPASGTVSTVESRVSQSFGRVTERVSDLSGDALQLTLYAIPRLPFSLGVLTLGYSWADARSTARGFDQNTGGDPRVRESGLAPFAPKHTFVVQAARTFGRWWGLTTFVRATSGTPFTPLVGGDVNGDGQFNDRAFVFNPAVATDTAVAGGMRTLMSSAPSWARTCLSGQLGSVAARNSCIGPWTATMNASVYVFPSIAGTGGRARAALTLVNVLGGVDQLLHGSNGLQGWGAAPNPDQTLLRVRSFDPGAQRFVYDVNPRFGSTSVATSPVRAPFRVTVDVSIDFGRSRAEQELEQNMRIRPALKGTRAPADSIKRRYMQNNFSDFYAYLVSQRMADSLALSQEQIQRIQLERDVLRRRADSIYVPLATWLAGQPDDFDHKEAIKRITDASNDVWKVIYAEKTFLLGLLSDGQLRLLPRPIFDMITVPNYQGRFFFGF